MVALKPYKVFKYGDIWAQGGQLIPLVVWTFILVRVYGAPYRPKSTSLGVLLVFFLPYIMAAGSIYRSWSANDPYDHSFENSLSLASLPPGWGYCFSKKVNDEERKKGIVGKYDYKCHGVNMNITYTMATDMLTRFYYVNYALLLLVITFYNNLSKRIFSSRYVLVCTSLSLLLGTLGTSVALFATYLSRSVWFGNVMAVLLTMNISCFVLLIHAIFARMTQY